jgi:hypothetical protein
LEPGILPGAGIYAFAPAGAGISQAGSGRRNLPNSAAAAPRRVFSHVGLEHDRPRSVELPARENKTGSGRGQSRFSEMVQL